MNKKPNVLMVAAENDALPNAKVGGIGDVVRDIPVALAELGCAIQVVMPSYGVLHRHCHECVMTYSVLFRGRSLPVSLWRYKRPDNDGENGHVIQWVIDHVDFAAGSPGQIYVNDSADRPFARDATKFAFFCAAVGQAILNESFGPLDILHLHDWHAASLAVLRQYHTHYTRLKTLKCVYTIHNLALQGVRPFWGDDSSLSAWFPEMRYDQASICDPKVGHCYNPMRAAINLADAVHAVSPSYALEIQHPSEPDKFIFGGEGLDVDLLTAQKQQRLFGILNGCEYTENVKSAKMTFSPLLDLIYQSLLMWAAQNEQLQSVHWIARERIGQWQLQPKPKWLITSIGRITDQKMRLLLHAVKFGEKTLPVLHHFLQALGDDGVYIVLGSGDTGYEKQLLSTMAQFTNFIFLRGFSEPLAKNLYSSGDLFLMPSSFEPCGISQMLAMRGGQPCLVHAVGGLKDTVANDFNGFSFTGDDGDAQALALLHKFNAIKALKSEHPRKFQTVARNAAKARFLWENAAQQYMSHLYTAGHDHSD